MRILSCLICQTEIENVVILIIDNIDNNIDFPALVSGLVFGARGSVRGVNSTFSPHGQFGNRGGGGGGGNGVCEALSVQTARPRIETLAAGTAVAQRRGSDGGRKQQHRPLGAEPLQEAAEGL